MHPKNHQYRGERRQRGAKPEARRANAGRLIEKAFPRASNVMLVHKGKKVRVGYRIQTTAPRWRIADRVRR